MNIFELLIDLDPQLDLKLYDLYMEKSRLKSLFYQLHFTNSSCWVYNRASYASAFVKMLRNFDIFTNNVYYIGLLWYIQWILFTNIIEFKIYKWLNHFFINTITNLLIFLKFYYLIISSLPLYLELIVAGFWVFDFLIFPPSFDFRFITFKLEFQRI